MYETLLRLYKIGKLTEAGLTNAVAKGWLAEDEKADIIDSISATSTAS
ncbi:XkdX family protein [Clostridium beijerinckii]|uniref:XkdX family protein n=1 Tax=Clostridium beijerinckii TaxID=1520 RepID=A0AAE5H976_CLOBE|nr:XkdX family protein [Clostridium beijerinckii]NSB16751.1 hypothetical protein [Clostridium beijerinckii]OOM19353.1 hypothetical protein CLOBE_53740 [Clostridium beijerinckii]